MPDAAPPDDAPGNDAGDAGDGDAVSACVPDPVFINDASDERRIEACGAKNVDVTSDSHNCGACGHAGNAHKRAIRQLAPVL